MTHSSYSLRLSDTQSCHSCAGRNPFLQLKTQHSKFKTPLFYHNYKWQVLAEYDGSDTLQRIFIYGNYIDEVLLMKDDTDEYYYAHDHLYSPAVLTDSSGTVVERYEYDAYGKPTIWNAGFTTERANSNYGNPYLFTGRRVDILDSGSLKLQYNRNRYYDYFTGRWLTHDPLGITPNPQRPNYFNLIGQYEDGQSLYEYVKSNPISNSDYIGLFWWWCCKNKCFVPGKIKDCKLKDWNIVPAGASPTYYTGIIKALGKAGSMEKIGPLGAKKAGKLVQAYATNWLFNIYFEFRYKKCEKERCCILWERYDWKKKKTYRKCQQPTNYEPYGDYGEFTTTDTLENLTKIIWNCIVEAKKVEKKCNKS